MIGRLFRLFLLVLMAPLLFAFSYEAFVFLASLVNIDDIGAFFRSTLWFWVGLIAFLFLYIVLLKDKIDFLLHLEHELEHAAMSYILSGKLPEKMVVNPQEKSEVGPVRGGCVTVLAPYYFPLFTVPLLLLKALAALAFHLLQVPFPPLLEGGLNFLIGLTFGLHFASLVEEFGPHQTDLKKTGMIFSIVTVLFLNLVLTTIVLAVVTQAYAGLLEYFKNSFLRTVDAYKAVFDFLQTRILPALGDLRQWLQDRFCKDCTPTPPVGF